MNNSIQQKSSVSGEDRAAVDKQLWQAIVDKRQVEIDAWNQRIEMLRDNLTQLGDDARLVAQKRLDDLVQARDQAVDQLSQLRQATQDNVENLLKQSDATFQNLAETFHDLVESNT